MTSFPMTALRDARVLVERANRRALLRLDPANAVIASYHLGYVDAAGTPTDHGGGKLIRGVLALLSARAVRGRDEVGATCGAAVELIHSFSLLHDDIIDRDETRRHRPTAWAVYGAPAAILAGDAMAALAMEILATDDLPAQGGAVRALAAATRTMLAGQSADMAFETVTDVSVERCQQMVAQKTGALLACAASIGAIASGAGETTAARLAEFGRHLGMAFQLVDDLLGIWGTEERTGKPVASDLVSRKKSLPVVAALAAGGPDADRLRALYAHEDPLSLTELAAAAAAVEGAGGRSWAQTEAEKETTAAMAVLDRVEIDDEVRRQLQSLAAMLGRRDE